MNYILVISMILYGCSLVAQEEHDHHDGHDHGSHHHYHVGIASGPVYVFEENELAPGLHLHVSRLFDLGSRSQFGTGLGFEAILDDHKHTAASVTFSYLPIHNLTFTAAPGLQFGEGITVFTTHFECAYEFIFDRIHIGPVAEYAWAPTDSHAMVGLHLGFGF
ncbi:MAG TPA: hypothetical protein DCX14_14580 [Flavobacteriales bacterium]|jgi:hypothetical protein|nr:hypothetical protein [Flavobacteriales bacterium]HAW21405.1 hypothetical protein [Flavobacteriales bacterium]